MTHASWSLVRRLMVIGAIVALPLTGYAQEATIAGTVTDSTGGVLPGVTTTALHEATGNTFVGVTDERGEFRLPVRIGAYRVTAELAGFATLTRTLEVLVGQTAAVNLQMAPSTVQESVTVTGEAPLVVTTSSTLAGNIDPRQMQELPVNGRNWMDLSLLAPGSRMNQSSEAPMDRQGYWQINVDGQQVSQLMSGGASQQARYSRDAIAEFEIVTNRFDATKGRSAGAVVNAVTKSGTNTRSGTFSGYFRDDRFNAADFIQGRVLPYSNQQVSTTFGGPIRKDRMHFFANYEYEREPYTITYSSQWPSFNIDQVSRRRQHMGLGRLDVQFSPQTRLGVTSQKYYQDIPFAGSGGASNHPSSSNRGRRFTTQFQVTLTQVLGSRAVNEVKGGFIHNNRFNDPNIIWPGGPTPVVRSSAMPVITLRGYSIGASGQEVGQALGSIRDDFTVSFSRGGGHNLKAGGEYLYAVGNLDWCTNCNGTIDATGGPVPANIEALFPVWNDVSTWNLAALSPITVRYRRAVGTFRFDTPRHFSAAWIQDDWTITPRLTLNLGVRHDLDVGASGENIKLLPWMSGDRPSDTNNLAPRLGFAFSLNDRTVIRGGYGTFFTQLSNDPQHNSMVSALTTIPEVPNDLRPDFAANPFNGPPPTFDEVIANACATARRSGCVRRELTSSISSPVHEIQYSHQASIGVQRQLGGAVAIEANYVYTGGRAEETGHNMNLSYDPATGVNYPFSDVSRRPFPDWGRVNAEFMNGRSAYHGLETSFTKRMSNRWQASATYTLSKFLDSNSDPLAIEFVSGQPDPIVRPLGFKVAQDLGAEWTLAASDQRHRAVFNGIWDAGYGFQLSGVYFYGSGQRLATNYGADLRDLGGTTGRLRPNSTIVPRNSLVGRPIHRVDVRIQRRIRLGGRASVDAILEAFNLFNHANYGSYTTNESNARYGQPSANTNIAYQPRMLQMGFRFAF